MKKHMEFELQPTLQGKLIEIRPLTPQDFEALFRAASDPLIWEQHPDSDRYRPEVFQKFFDGAIESGARLPLLSASRAGSSAAQDIAI